MRAESEYNEPPFHSVMKYFSFVMTLVYPVLGILLILKSSDLFNIPSSYSILLGSIMIAYGAFRGYQVYQKYF
jgi:hypothetical protein